MTAMTVLGSLTLPGARRSVAHARRFTRDMLGAAHPRADDIELCTSELATNAVLHSASGRDGVLTIIAAEDERAIQISVLDDGADDSTEPRISPDPAGEHGHGLVIVRELADDWGTDAVGGRTAVWFRIDR